MKSLLGKISRIAPIKSSRPEVFCKKGVLKISQNSQENTCPRASFLETLAQVFSCEFCEIFTNPYLNRTPLVAASDL